MLRRDFYEFFAGGGMARSGLGQGWRCRFANDFDPRKAASYAGNGPSEHLHVGDVRGVAVGDLPGRADLAWASFPCQDLSLAGRGAGLASGRSGSFWPFWDLMTELRAQGRAPRTIVLENVYGVLTSRGGRDFASLGDALASQGYRFGAMLLDGELFVPQSRPRVFIIGISDEVEIPACFISPTSLAAWHPPGMISAVQHFGQEAAARWVWWNPTPPPLRTLSLADILERDADVTWHSAAETAHITGMMTAANAAKVAHAMAARERRVGAVYRRTRPDRDGTKRQRAEVRFDGIAGCLRTPSGGSSRQVIMVVDGGEVRTRLLSAREAARLMGLPDSYVLPTRYNDAYRLVGDGLVVPAVSYLARGVIEPILDAAVIEQAAA